jgi:hypothetical protein
MHLSPPTPLKELDFKPAQQRAFFSPVSLSIDEYVGAVHASLGPRMREDDGS